MRRQRAGSCAWGSFHEQWRPTRNTLREALQGLWRAALELKRALLFADLQKFYGSFLGPCGVKFRSDELALWRGAHTEEEALQEYLRERMWAAFRRLSVTADVFGEVLVEIIELQDEKEALPCVSP